MPTNGLHRDRLLPRSSAPQRFLQFFLARFSDSLTVVLEDLLPIRGHRTSGFGGSVGHGALSCVQDKSRFWIRFKVILNLM
jgi:hypothetical protein